METIDAREQDPVKAIEALTHGEGADADPLAQPGGRVYGRKGMDQLGHVGSPQRSTMTELSTASADTSP